jgi:enolase
VAQLITDLHLLQVLDSRGDPTIKAFVTVSDGQGAATAPAGASAGSHEAAFLRDHQSEYGGRSVQRVIAERIGALRSALIGINADDPALIEHALVQLDRELPNTATTPWSALGGNVAMAISVASWLAVSDAVGRAPWQVMSTWCDTTPTLPMPMVNIVSGGAHAAKAIDIQDVLALPFGATTVEDAIHKAWRTRAATRDVLHGLGHATSLVADEGGLAAPFASSSDAVAAVHRAILNLGSAGSIGIALDVAATEFQDGPNHYALDGAQVSGEDLVSRILQWTEELGVISVEDPIGEDDDWAPARPLLNRVQVIGDDRYVTNTTRLQTGIDADEANAILIKPNQAGSLLRTMQALLLAKRNGWRTVVSARSGETEENWLVDLAVGTGAGQIKVGSTMRSERTAKWNRLLELSSRENLPFAEWIPQRGSR